MITTEQMEASEKKTVKLTYTDGEEFVEKCICYYQAEDEDEEAMLEFKSGMVNQSEIEKIEILD